MFCNKCGSELPSGATVCAACGRPIQGTAVAVAPSGRDLKSHLSLLTIFWYVVGALWVIPTAMMIFIAIAAGTALRDEEPVARVAGPVLFIILGVLLGIGALLSFLTAWGLQHRRPWARTLAIVLAILSLVHIPLGTALGIYTLVVLMPGDAGRQYEQMAAAAAEY